MEQTFLTLEEKPKYIVRRRYTHVPPEPEPEPEPEPLDPLVELKSMIVALKADITRLETREQTARDELKKALSQLDRERETASALRAQLIEEVASSEKARSELALALQRMETTEKPSITSEDVRAEVRRAITMLPPRPEIEPPTYEMRIVGRDLNSRAERVILAPMKSKINEPN